jgi:hypothetical protein
VVDEVAVTSFQSAATIPSLTAAHDGLATGNSTRRASKLRNSGSLKAASNRGDESSANKGFGPRGDERRYVAQQNVTIVHDFNPLFPA